MELALTPEQQLLRETITRLLREDYDFTARQRAKEGADGWDRGLWSAIAREGFLSLLVAEEHGGFGGGGVDAMIVMQALGGALSLEPYLPTAIVAAPAIAEFGTVAQRDAILPGLLAGETIVSFAHAEGDGRDNGPSFATRATVAGGDWRINGEKVLAAAAATADLLLVSADTDGGACLFLVEAAAPGVERRPYRMHDGTRAADLVLRDAPAQPVGEPGGDAVAVSVARAVAGLVAEGAGVATAAYELTLEHLRTRHQFGKPIGANQALQHRAAEMLVALELCRSMALFAASAPPLPPPLRAARLAQAKAVIGRQGWAVVDAAVQLHGGMGMVEEYPAGVCLKRLLVIDGSFGAADRQIAFLAEHPDPATL